MSAMLTVSEMLQMSQSVARNSLQRRRSLLPSQFLLALLLTLVGPLAPTLAN